MTHLLFSTIERRIGWKVLPNDPFRPCPARVVQSIRDLRISESMGFSRSPKPCSGHSIFVIVHAYLHFVFPASGPMLQGIGRRPGKFPVSHFKTQSTGGCLTHASRKHLVSPRTAQ